MYLHAVKGESGPVEPHELSYSTRGMTVRVRGFAGQRRTREASGGTTNTQRRNPISESTTEVAPT
jgi:hypothetical protein